MMDKGYIEVFSYLINSKRKILYPELVKRNGVIKREFKLWSENYLFIKKINQLSKFFLLQLLTVTSA